MTMTTHYGTKAKELRVKRAWSQEQLADIADVNVRTIQRIERGDGAAFETLKALANALDVDVSELLTAPPPDQKAGGKQEDTTSRQNVEFLGRVRTGRELFGIVAGAHMCAMDHDELQDVEVDPVASALQDIHDWADMWAEMEPAQRVHAAHDFTSRIKELEELGLWVFAGARSGTYRIETALGEKTVKMTTATVMITRGTNPAIIRLEGDDGALPVAHRER